MDFEQRLTYSLIIAGIIEILMRDIFKIPGLQLFGIASLILGFTQMIMRILNDKWKKK